jgi:hypothetical protein
MVNDRKNTLFSDFGIRIELDLDEVYPDDPGNGTPAMVYVKHPKFGECSGTYWRVLDTGEVDGPRSELVELTPEQVAWIGDQEDEVNEFLFGKADDEEED